MHEHLASGFLLANNARRVRILCIRTVANSYPQRALSNRVRYKWSSRCQLLLLYVLVCRHIMNADAMLIASAYLLLLALHCAGQSHPPPALSSRSHTSAPSSSSPTPPPPNTANCTMAMAAVPLLAAVSLAFGASIWAACLFCPLLLLLCRSCVKRLRSRSDGNDRRNQLERSPVVHFRSLAPDFSAQQQQEQLLEKSVQHSLGTSLEAHGIAMPVRASPQPQQQVLQTVWRPDSLPHAAIANWEHQYVPNPNPDVQLSSPPAAASAGSGSGICGEAVLSTPTALVHVSHVLEIEQDDAAGIPVAARIPETPRHQTVTIAAAPLASAMWPEEDEDRPYRVVDPPDPRYIRVEDRPRAAWDSPRNSSPARVFVADTQPAAAPVAPATLHDATRRGAVTRPKRDSRSADD